MAESDAYACVIRTWRTEDMYLAQYKTPFDAKCEYYTARLPPTDLKQQLWDHCDQHSDTL